MALRKEVWAEDVNLGVLLRWGTPGEGVGQEEKMD